MNEISELQSQIIDLILEGHRMTEIAKETGVRRTQIYRWLDREAFKAELESRRAQLRKAASDKITGKVDHLVSNMLDMANNSTDNRVRFNANKYLLDRALGIPVAAKEVVTTDGSDKGNNTNDLKKELEEIKNLSIVK